MKKSKVKKSSWRRKDIKVLEEFRNLFSQDYISISMIDAKLLELKQNNEKSEISRSLDRFRDCSFRENLSDPEYDKIDYGWESSEEMN